MLINNYFGRLCFEVKTQSVGEDKIVFNNRVALNYYDDTTFIDVVAWNKTAEIIEKNYKNGYEILFQGRLINKDRIKDDVNFQTVAILIERVFPVHGNKSQAIERLDENVINQFDDDDFTFPVNPSDIPV